MSKPFDFGGVNLNAGGDASGGRPLEETPFCIAILADFSGRANRTIRQTENIASRKAVLVDRDNFEEVLARYKPELELKLSDSGSLHLRFGELDDFHPDRLFEQVEAFSTLRNLRTRLEDPSSFGQAAEELGLRSGQAAARPSSNAAPAVAPSPAKLASGSLLDDMIEETESRPQDPLRKTADPVRDFAKRVAEQSLVNSPDPRQPEILSVMDRAIGALMRAVLHNPDFQALEALWRATFLLVRQLETGSQLKIYLFDISKDELAVDQSSGRELRQTGLYRLLVEKSVETPGAEPWSLIVGNFTFGPGQQDVAVLSRVAAVARRAGAPFLAHASSRILGCSSIAAASHPRDWKDAAGGPDWLSLRARPEADAIGLALPRFLLRLPYGKNTSSLESFDFEELGDSASHEDYLWGNPAFAVALLLAQAFEQAGWEMRAGSAVELAGVPLHIYRRDGASEAKPCAEVLLTQEALESILDAGLIPLVSFKNRDAIRVARFQSLSSPPRPLAGRWLR
ncbi:MAG TPA: type VI secretion system contractile sheath large subunit [Candidatus Sulfotelmatobacter sp.]|nr:type VI secretion system contractile sheath large subunit [Candidatus Sulfotelmatobacter sp.]